LERLSESSVSPHRVDCHIVSHNKTGLSELYQHYLEDTLADYITFIHDDLEIHDMFFFEKLISAHQTYDIVGLAGATSQDYSNITVQNGSELPLVWHLRKTKPEHGRGIVSHVIPKGFNNAEKAHINSAYFGPTPDEVVVIDGLFMSFKRESMTKDEKVLQLFDPKYSFHFYDMAMCVNAKRCNLKIGTWPIYCLHHGLGEFANDSTWIRLSKDFKHQFNNYKVSV
jgi:GT2 family glycosyltransferase